MTTSPVSVGQNDSSPAASVPWGLLLGAVMLGGAVLFMSKSMRPNRRRGRYRRYRRNSSDDARFALRLLKSGESPSASDSARFERGHRELTEAFAHYDQASEGGEFHAIDPEKMKLGREYDSYLSEKRRNSMSSALDKSDSWDF